MRGRLNTALILGLLTLLVSGCALTEADSTRQRLYAIDRQFAAVVNTATTLKRDGKLSRDQVNALDRSINTANEALDVAHTAIKAGDDQTATEQIHTVQSMIVEIQDVIREAKG